MSTDPSGPKSAALAAAVSTGELSQPVVTVLGSDPSNDSAPTTRKPHQRRSPLRVLLLGLVVMLCSVLVYSYFTLRQIRRLREMQRELVDRNRRDSLQLLRIQNDLNSLAIAMRDMLDGEAPYPVTAWEPQFKRLRSDLNNAIELEDKLAAVQRTPAQRRYVTDSVARFWSDFDHVFQSAAAGRQSEALALVRGQLQTEQANLSVAISRMLVDNNRMEEEAGQTIQQVYSGVEHQLYLYLAATLAGILATGIAIAVSSRRNFAEIELLSRQRSELAHNLITTQESTFQALSRELHDEFGQILTAIGSLLGRAERKAPADSEWKSEIHHVREIAQETLENVRTLSQALHPVTLDEAGLESAIEWYLPTVERSHHVRIKYTKIGEPFPVDGKTSVHLFRILQEALNNAIRHSGSEELSVQLRFEAHNLILEVEDCGKGMISASKSRGIGLTAMRERTQILGGEIRWLDRPSGGTTVQVKVPRERS